MTIVVYNEPMFLHTIFQGGNVQTDHNFFSIFSFCLKKIRKTKQSIMALKKFKTNAFSAVQKKNWMVQNGVQIINSFWYNANQILSVISFDTYNYNFCLEGYFFNKFCCVKSPLYIIQYIYHYIAQNNQGIINLPEH